MMIKDINGALNLTRTLNNPEVNPAKNPRIKENKIAKTKNSCVLIKPKCCRIFPDRKKNPTVSINNKTPSSALSNKNALLASQRNGR